MDALVVYGEIDRFLEYAQLKKTLKAFRKENGGGEKFHSEGTLSAETLIDCILSCRKSRLKKNRKREREREDSDHATTVSTNASCVSTSQTSQNGDSTQSNTNGKQTTNGATLRQPLRLKRHKTDQEKHKKEDIRQSTSHHNANSSFNSVSHGNVDRDSTCSSSAISKVNRDSNLPFMSSCPPVEESISSTPLRRLDVRKSIESISNPRLLDQSYSSKGGDTFAAKAARDLQKVRGKDFRREMLKKKRSSWKGFGVIEERINSIQFNSD